jgi:hypothetical protein
MSIPFTWVYLIYDPFTGLYKIGKADNPEARLKQLCGSQGTIAAAPTEYELIEAWLCPTEMESEMHTLYSEVRERGEWFDLSDFYRVPNGETDEISYRVSSVLSFYQRFYAKQSFESETNEITIAQLEYKVDELNACKRQLDQARLMGYEPKLLYPAPAIDPDSAWPNVIAERCDGENAAAIDLLQESGDIAF